MDCYLYFKILKDLKNFKAAQINKFKFFLFFNLCLKLYGNDIQMHVFPLYSFISIFFLYKVIFTIDEIVIKMLKLLTQKVSVILYFSNPIKIL